MTDLLWLARVRCDLAYDVASVAPAPADWRSRIVDDSSFIVSAPDAEEALKRAARILTRARQRAQLSALALLGREGYAKALDDLLTFVREAREANTAPAVDLTPESAEANGRWFGRADALDTIERWALSMRPPKETAP